MDLPVSWLNDYVNTKDITVHQMVRDMTMSGSKVEGFKFTGEGIENVVVAKVLTLEPHPDSDHLLVCTVDAGRGTPLTIVTGAANMKVNDLVPVALDGSTLPDGKVINAGKLRGILSEGMLCSYQELGLTRNFVPYAPDHGILVLNDKAEAGEDIRDALLLNDYVVEFEITPNRPDCLGILGLAREVGATFGIPCDIKQPECVAGSGSINDHLEIDVFDRDLCPVYSARMLKNIKIAPSPLWMRARLQAAGVRPINNIVDITNYVMLEYGQPMHAFDYTCLNGGNIIVRRAKTGEHFTTLDGKQYDLEDDMLVIADKERPVGLAGIMGGLNSEITENTKMVVFESANFLGSSIRVSSRKLGFRTDASSRFEKGLDPAMTIPALERACELAEELNAGEVVGGMIHIGEPIENRKITLDCDRINALLGLSVTREKMLAILRSLNFREEDGRLVIPTYRGDVECMADIAEEIARIYGYNNIPSTLFKGTTSEGGLTESQRTVRNINHICRGLGYSEISTYSFISPKYYDDILLPENSPLRKSVVITNPLGEDVSVMRTTALPSMMGILARNRNKRHPEAKLYEPATVYIPATDKNGSPDPTVLPDERNILILGEYGKDSDFYALKGAVESLFDALGITGAEFLPEKGNPSYHPGRCAAISCDGKNLGTVGQVHPKVTSRYGIDMPVFTAELDLEGLLSEMAKDIVYRPLPKFPATTRDLAIICDEAVTSSEIAAIIKGNSECLESADLFDVYRGAQIPTGKKSMAYSLIFRDNEKTMTDDHADRIMSGILSALEKAFGASLR